MSALGSGWTIKGIYNETCASEGHCPYYFGRDKEGGCRYFMVFRIVEGEVDGVDLAGITAIYLGDLPHATYAEAKEKGSEGAIYIDDSATTEQRAILDALAVEALGGVLMKKVFGISYVPISVEDDGDSVRFEMPTGEMEMVLTKGPGGGPVRMENVTLPFLLNVKAAHTPHWHWSDFGRHFEYKDRCGTWADFAMVSPAD